MAAIFIPFFSGRGRRLVSRAHPRLVIFLSVCFFFCFFFFPCISCLVVWQLICRISKSELSEPLRKNAWGRRSAFACVVWVALWQCVECKMERKSIRRSVGHRNYFRCWNFYWWCRLPPQKWEKKKTMWLVGQSVVGQVTIPVYPVPLKYFKCIQTCKLKSFKMCSWP